MTTVAGVPITHPERVVYPDLAVTKLDVARWYARIAPRMLPHVAGRPLALVRCPEGVAGECFFQKHWTGKVPAALDTVRIRQANGTRRDYVMVHDATGLVTLAQWNILEIHLWGSRAAALAAPDRVVFDLDPAPDVPWAAVRTAARDVRTALAALGLTSWLKTTGGKGLHVVVPLAGPTTWDRVSGFARAVAERIANAAPERYLTEASRAARGGKVFLDWLRNTRGATWIAPWSVRSRAGAGVSVPLPWSRLGRTTGGDQWRLPSLLAGRLPADAWGAMSATRQRLPRAVTDALREGRLER